MLLNYVVNNKTANDDMPVPFCGAEYKSFLRMLSGDTGGKYIYFLRHNTSIILYLVDARVGLHTLSDRSTMQCGVDDIQPTCRCKTM